MVCRELSDLHFHNFHAEFQQFDFCGLGVALLWKAVVAVALRCVAMRCVALMACTMFI